MGRAESRAHGLSIEEIIIEGESKWMRLYWKH